MRAGTRASARARFAIALNTRPDITGVHRFGGPDRALRTVRDGGASLMPAAAIHACTCRIASGVIGATSPAPSSSVFDRPDGDGAEAVRLDLKSGRHRPSQLSCVAQGGVGVARAIPCRAGHAGCPQRPECIRATRRSSQRCRLLLCPPVRAVQPFEGQLDDLGIDGVRHAGRVVGGGDAEV